MTGKGFNTNKNKSSSQTSSYNTRSIKDLMNPDIANKSNPLRENTDHSLILHEILDKITRLSNDIVEVKSQLLNINTTIRAIVVEEMSIKEKAWIEERDAIKKRLDYVEHRDEMRLRQEKRNNIIIRGYKATTNDYKQEVAKMLQEKLQLEINVLEASLIKTARGSQLISAKIDTAENKRSIMTNKKRLGGTEIYISSDHTKEERKIQSELYRIADIERKHGKEVRIGYRKIFIDGTMKVWKDGIGLSPIETTTPPSQDLQRNLNEVSPFRDLDFRN